MEMLTRVKDMNSERKQCERGGRKEIFEVRDFLESKMRELTQRILEGMRA